VRAARAGARAGVRRAAYRDGREDERHVKGRHARAVRDLAHHADHRVAERDDERGAEREHASGGGLGAAVLLLRRQVLRVARDGGV
jgi:hypothetical protein